MNLPTMNPPIEMDPIYFSAKTARTALSVAVLLSTMSAVNVSTGQEYVSPPLASSEVSTINSSTRWVFRSFESVTVSSPIVRLGDVIAPVNPGLAAWQRLARSPIGLVPIGGQPMIIDRNRLNNLILNAEATPRSIDWLGPKRIRVEYRKGAISKNQTTTAPNIEQATYRTSKPVAGDQPKPNHPPMTALETQRVVHWIELAITRFQPDIPVSFEIAVEPNQPGIIPLRAIGGVSHLAPVDQVAAGPCQFHVEARTAEGPINAIVEVTLVAHPQVVVSRRALGRGQRVKASDLELRPFAADKLGTDFMTDVDAVAGMEVRSSLRAGTPVAMSDIGPPILIHRGDLIEIRVLGGGVRVSTNAKSLGSGAVGELIEVETMNPRKRLAARVADIGVVEIVTRAPVVR